MKSRKSLVLLIVMILIVSMLLVACEKKDEVIEEEISFGKWKVVKLPTVDSVGSITRKGSDGKDYTFELPILTSENYIVDVMQEPTCEEEGYNMYTIKVTGGDFAFKVSVPKIGHAYTVEYAWSDDNSSCTALHKCANNSSHNELINATITKVVTKPSFDNAGSIKYTATFDEDWAVTQEKVVVGEDKYTLTKIIGKEPTCLETGLKAYWAGSNGVNYEDETHTKVIENLDTWREIPALGHKFATATYKWSDDYSKCTAIRVCQRDASHVESVTVNSTKEVTDPTFDKAGSIKYTATFDKDWTIAQEKVVVGEDKYTLTKVNGKEPTCLETGLKAYWAGSNGVNFEDEARTKVIEDVDTWRVIDKVTLKHYDAVLPTFEKAGSIEYWECPTCKTKYSSSVASKDSIITDIVVPMYELSKVDRVEPTVNSTGNIEYWAGTDGKYYDDANRSNEITFDSTIIAKVKVFKVDKVEPTYGTDGVMEYYHDNDNNKYLLGDDGLYTEVTDAELVINELKGAITFYINGVANAPIEHLKSKEFTQEEIDNIVTTSSNDEYSGYAMFGSDAYASTINLSDVNTLIANNRYNKVYISKSYEVTIRVNYDKIIKQLYWHTTYGDIEEPVVENFVFNGWLNNDHISIDDQKRIETKPHTIRASVYTDGLKFDYNEDKTGLIVTSYSRHGNEIIVPSYVKSMDNLPVRVIDEGVFVNKFGSMELPDTITKICDRAFAGCKSSMNIPSSVEYIGNMAFMNSNLGGDILLPKDVKFIGVGAFDGTNVTSLKISEENQYYTSRSTDGTECNAIMYIGDTPYEATNAIEPFDIKKGYVLGTLTNGTIPDNANTIVNCTIGGDLIIPSSVKTIKSYAISDTTVNSITWEDSEGAVIEHHGMFSNGELVSVKLPKGIVSMGNNALSDNGALTSVVIPDTLTDIGNGVFLNDNALTGIYLEHTTMPNWSGNWNTINIGSPAIQVDAYLYSATNIVDEYNNKVAGYWRYVNGEPTVWDAIFDLSMQSNAYKVDSVYSNGTDVVVPDTYNNVPIVSISSTAFATVPNIKKLTLGNNINSIEKGALSTLVLTDIKLTNMDILLDEDALSQSASSIVNYYGPANVYNYMYNNGMKKNPESTLEHVTLYNDNNTVYEVQFNDMDSLIDITLLDGVYEVQTQNLANLRELKAKTICEGHHYTFMDNCPSVVKASIGVSKEWNSTYNAFWDNPDENITKNVLQDNITTNSEYDYIVSNGEAFITRYKGESTDAIVPKTIDGYPINAEYGYGAYLGNSTITSLTMSDEMTKAPSYIASFMQKLRTVNLNNVTEIGNRAFAESSITNIDLRKVESIANGAFYYCEALTSVILNPNAIIEDEFNSATNVVFYINGSTVPGNSNVWNKGGHKVYTYSESKPTVVESGRDGYWHYNDAHEIEVWALNDYFVVEPTAVDAGDYRIVRYVGSNQDLTIPASINDKPITDIKANAFENNSNIVTLNINCANIGDNAFKGCSTLRTLVIGENTSYIGKSAFENCSALTSVSISTGITLIDSNAFCNAGITSLNMAIINTHNVSIASDAFDNIKITDLTLDGRYILAICSFSNCAELATVTLKQGCIAGNPLVFKGCDKLTTITTTGKALVTAGIAVENVYVTDGVAKFAGGESRGTVHFGKDVTINEETFLLVQSRLNILVDPENPTLDVVNNCIVDKATRKIVYYGNNEGTLPENITTIGKYAFSYSSMTSIVLPNTLKEIKQNAFEASSLTSIHIPMSVEYLEDNVFANCQDLTTIEVENVESAINSAWNSEWKQYCDANVVYGTGITTDPTYNYVLNGENAVLVKYKGTDTNITIPDTIDGHNVTEIADLFSENKSITSITMGNYMTHIGNKAFYYCDNLQSVDLKNVTHIGDDAFYHNDKLLSIDLKSVQHIGARAFAQNSFSSIVIPASVTTMGEDAFAFSQKVTSITINTTSLEVLEAGVFSEAQVKTFNVPEGVKKINGIIFGNSIILESLTIPTTLEEFSPSAFGSPKLKDIRVAPGNTHYTSRDANGHELNGVVYIGIEEKLIPSGYYGMCMYYRNNFILGGINTTTIPKQVIGNSGAAEDVVGIGAYAYVRREIKSIVIHDKIKRIEDSAFESTNMIQSIEIQGNTLEHIGASAFNTEGTWTSIILPQSVKYVGRAAFTKAEITIYCRCSEASAKNWDLDWCSQYSTVVWDYKG